MSKIQKNSKPGFHISIRDRGEIVRYRDGERMLEAQISIVDGITTLYTWHVRKWDSPVKGTSLTDEEFRQVKQRLLEWLSQDSKHPVVVDDSPPETIEQAYERMKKECTHGWEVVMVNGQIIRRRLS